MLQEKNKLATLLFLVVSVIIWFYVLTTNNSTILNMNPTMNFFRPTGPETFNFKSLADIQETIWKQIESLQEAGDCENKKILICENIGSFAGLGSMLMRYGACYQLAYALGRIVFIVQKQYAHFGGLSHWLQESRNCSYLKGKYETYTNVCNMHNPECYDENNYEVNNTYKVLHYNSNMRFPAPRRIPTTMPKVIEQALKDLNVDMPWLWFTSQFLGYILLHPNTYFERLYRNFSMLLNFDQNVVGLHIRRGDKIGREFANYIDESLFVLEAEKYFNKSLPKQSKRKIYVASDDKNISKKLQRFLTSDYELLRLPDWYLKKALNPYKVEMFPKEVLESMLLEFYFLAKASFTICTYTSNVCRILHSLKLATHPFTAKDRILSMDQPKLSMYWWFPFKAPLSGYWLTIRGNSRNKTFFDGTKLLTYKQGTLFHSNYGPVLIKQNLDTYSVLLANTIYSKQGAQYGYIFYRDVISWPGSPKYHFYPI